MAERSIPYRHAMGFDQYHEPPEELSEKTRTFARMITSLIEEAEAIGWYEQRIVVEKDREASAIMKNAQHEEMKHFGWISSSCCGKSRSGGDAPRHPVQKGRHRRTWRRGGGSERR